MVKHSLPEVEISSLLEIKNHKLLFQLMKVFITIFCKKKPKNKEKVENKAAKLNDYFESINTSIN
jgi:hypothetical protein